MAKRRQLSKKQLAVIEDLFQGQLDEQTVLEKHQVSRNLYYKWLADETFAEYFDRRIAGCYRQSATLIARYAPLAAAKLVQLTESNSQETARKACLDIISMSAQTPDPRPQETQSSKLKTQNCQLSPQTASRLLAALAEEKDDKKQSFG